ncbi:MAG: cytochrome C [Alphaproteobacteria bacterium]|nr:MAG: cytochrome C [Alphaproteobacteria bacterium]
MSLVHILALVGVVGAAAPAVAQTAAPQPLPTPLIAQACRGCHGQAGLGMEGTPAIVGMDPATFQRLWGEFRANQRPATIMNRIARGYSDQEVATLAAYFAVRQ